MRTAPALDDLQALDKATLIAMLVRMAEQMEALKRELAITAAALAECQGRLALNSTNSSKPPSSDGLNKPKPKSQRQSGKRASGGQPGHPGKTLRQVAEPDHVEQHGPAPQCDACGLMLQAQVVQVRQVFDLPAKRHEVTEHQLMQAQCQCGKVHRGVFPAGVAAPVQYGPRVLAAAAYLNQHQMLPQQRSAKLLGEVCGLPMSAATVQMATQRVQGQITPVVLAIRQALLGVLVLNADESGLRVMKLLQWLHVACTDTLVWMARHAKRGKEAFDALELLPQYHGVLVHDGWQPYRDLMCLHALCNAHHLRELIFLAEELKQSWAREMIDLLRLSSSAASCEIPAARVRTIGTMRPSSRTCAAPPSSRSIAARSISWRSSSATVQRTRTDAPAMPCWATAARRASRSGLPSNTMSRVRRAGVGSSVQCAPSASTPHNKKPFSPSSP